MKVLYVFLFILFAATATFAAEKAPVELLAGYSKGFSNTAMEEPDQSKVTFLNKQHDKVLVLTGAPAKKWCQWSKDLGPCYLSQPKVAIANAKGEKGTVYRFQGGVIVSSPKGTFVLNTFTVMSWESQGGPKGRLGFPTSDMIPMHRVPANPDRAERA